MQTQIDLNQLENISIMTSSPGSAITRNINQQRTISPIV